MDGVDQPESAPTPIHGASAPTTTQPRVVLALCPYLSTIDGNWRSSSAVREHRCTAVSPPVPLALEKQRRLCLVAEHTACATYGAAEAARPAQPPRPDGHLRTIARTTPVVIDQRRFDLRLPVRRPDRISGQALLVAVLGLAFAAIVIARPGSAPGTLAPSGNSASVAPAPTTTASVTATPRRSAAPSAPVVTARPVGSPAPSGAAQATNPPASAPPAGSTATYKVKSGDTLTAIAARYGTTVKILMTLNGITDPSKLRVGQILKLP